DSSHPCRYQSLQPTRGGPSIGSRHGQADALQGLGQVARKQGEYEQAAKHLQEALALYQDIGDRHGQANAHLQYARLAETQGRRKTASHSYRSAAKLYAEIGLHEWADRCSADYQRIQTHATPEADSRPHESGDVPLPAAPGRDG
ncbi:tetratricopeptide repeat protein, partial [Actinomadura keratinilytica]